MTFAPASRLGPFEILGPLGAGGMGEVWRARDTKLDREVALKFLPASFAESPERLARFEREAKVLASLNHPHIAAIYGFHEHESHRFLAMELVPGEDLAERLKRGRLPFPEAIDLARQIAEALEAAHERGVIHRDLKPANIKLTPDGMVKVLDFGLAKALDPASDGGSSTPDPSMSPTITSLGTVAGVILGTAAYMSPEAARGRSVDKRADIWAFGCVLYEMLGGTLAFSGETVSDTMAAVLTRDPDWSVLPADVPPGVRGVLLRCLRKDPKERLRDIGDARIELHDAPTSAPPATLPPPAARRSLPPWLLAVAAVGILAAALAGIVYGRRLADTRPPVFRPLMFGNGAVFSARLAPDGQTAVYAAALEGRPLTISSTRLDSVQSRPLDLPSADVAGISRDGQMALILGRHHDGSWLRVGTLAQVGLSGGTPRELLEDVYDADIAPDGKQFAVVLRDGDDQVLQYPIGKEVFRSKGWIGQPRIAPDGRRIAFVDHRLPGDDLGEIKLLGADGKVALLGSEQQYTHGLCWSPDGATVWYSNYEDFAGGVLFAVSPGNAPRRMARTPLAVRVQDVTPDGRILVVVDDTWVTLAGQLAGDASERVYSFWSTETLAGIAGDGSSFAGTDNVVVNGEYSVFFRRGSTPPVVLGSGLAAGMTPDAKFVLATTLSGTVGGFTMLPVGPGQPRPLDLHGVSLVPSDSMIRFSSDGRRFAFIGAKPGEGRAAWVLDLGDGVPRKVSPEGASAAIISPDGTKVLVADRTRGLYVVSSAGNVPIPGAPKNDFPLAWMTDGSAVLSWDRTLPPRIFKTELATGRRTLFREVQSADPAGMLYGSLLLTPDDRFYLQRYRRVRSSLTLVSLHG
jgi:hypothetical protein